MSQSASGSLTEEFRQLWSDSFSDEIALVLGDAGALGVFNVVFDAGLVGQEGVVQYHEVVILHAKNVALEIKDNIVMNHVQLTWKHKNLLFFSEILRKAKARSY